VHVVDDDASFRTAIERRLKNAGNDVATYPSAQHQLDRLKGVYQHCAEKHLHRYLSEFDFRYSNRVALGIGDGEPADLAIKGAAGKRLTYRQPH
jgi:hypothetical protein